MTTERQRLANLKNARASTGPKSVKGKAAASRNALRHGLAVAITTEMVFSKTVEEMGRKIAGAGASDDVLACAMRIAEAELDVRRIRNVRNRFLEPLLRMIDGTTAGTPMLDPSPRLNGAESSPARGETHGMDLFLALQLSDPDLLRKICSLDRYERRARSRRKFAIRDLDAARRHAMIGDNVDDIHDVS